MQAQPCTCARGPASAARTPPAKKHGPDDPTAPDGIKPPRRNREAPPKTGDVPLGQVPSAGLGFLIDVRADTTGREAPAPARLRAGRTGPRSRHLVPQLSPKGGNWACVRAQMTHAYLADLSCIAFARRALALGCVSSPDARPCRFQRIRRVSDATPARRRGLGSPFPIRPETGRHLSQGLARITVRVRPEGVPAIRSNRPHAKAAADIGWTTGPPARRHVRKTGAAATPGFMM